MQLMRNSFILRKLSNSIMKMSETNIPLVVIIGATGCAKTKLSIEIAKRFDGQVISADSMQVYKGLDIITNKATPEEQRLVPHHMIGFLDPSSRFSVIDFRNRALKVIDQLMSTRKVPVLVGGTNYYIESILWDVLIQTNEESDDKPVFDREIHFETNPYSDQELTKDNIFVEPIYSHSFKDISNCKLHSILEELDPNSALYIHPNDRRKVIRSLQIFQQNNRSKSELIEEQKSSKGGSQYGGPLRFDNSLILWVDCEQSVLNQRLDKRVDEMMEKGLIEELLDFHYRYNKQRISENLSADYSKGIFQSIGFKEFHNYLLLTSEQRKNPTTNALLNSGVNSLKLVTKRYVNHQLKWIRNRFLKLNDRNVPNIYRLNTTNLELWEQEVLEPAIAIINAYMHKTVVPEYIKPEPRIQMRQNYSKVFRCDVCHKLMSGLVAYESHLVSKGHKYRLNHKKQKFHQLLSLLKTHEKNLLNERRNSI